ncbi:MAG: WXG100 family type VII secretion target [Blautia sp.]|nr:WXG100 family type VII secretion target [Blautia sp.]
MAIAYEGNTDLGFDTGILRKAAGEYRQVAADLKGMASRLDSLLFSLKEDGWTTPAGTAFYEMTNTNWEQNIEKYVSLLETLNSILISAAEEYDGLVADHIRTTSVNL